MKEQILKLCKGIEHKYNVEILFCVENGSRAWNMESEDSDYDIRFVYKRPLESYLKLNPPKDVISETFDKDGKSCQVEGSYFDMLGFDIYKFGRMLLSSNPTTIEWTTATIVYLGKIPKVFYKFATEQYNPVSVYHHYRSMCNQNYLKYLKSGAKITYKKYLYAMRGLVNAKYVSVVGKIPPLDFLDTIEEFYGVRAQGVDALAPHIIESLKQIITFKKSGNERDIVKNIVQIDNYIEDFLKKIEAPDPRKSFCLDVERFIIDEVTKCQ